MGFASPRDRNLVSAAQGCLRQKSQTGRNVRFGSKHREPKISDRLGLMAVVDRLDGKRRCIDFGIEFFVTFRLGEILAEEHQQSGNAEKLIPGVPPVTGYGLPPHTRQDVGFCFDRHICQRWCSLTPAGGSRIEAGGGLVNQWRLLPNPATIQHPFFGIATSISKSSLSFEPRFARYRAADCAHIQNK